MSVIQMNNVSWVRGQTAILQDINWIVSKGEHWALIGLNGSGKTSLLNLINGYNWPTKGQIEVLGRQFGRTDLCELRKHIGWVSVSMADRITTDKPYEHAIDVVKSGKYASVGLWTPEEEGDMQLAYEQMQRLGCAHLSEKPIHVLSQGEKQRVLIARAMMSKLELLILDEPCTGLDLFARESLLQTIEFFTRESEGPTILYVTHHTEEVVPGITHALLLKDGKMAAKGSKRDVLSNHVLSEAFQLNVQVDWADERAWLRVGS